MDPLSVTYEASLQLPAAGGGAALARDFTRESLVRWNYPGRHDDVILAVSELVSNALRHASGTPVLRLAGIGDRVRIEVADGSPVLPVARPAGPHGGWGLGLVQRLSVRWDALPRDGGKVVWCEMGPDDPRSG